MKGMWAAPTVFALAWQGSSAPVGEAFSEFTTWLSGRTGLRIVPRCALSYIELARMVESGEADLAWLPPIVFVQLERRGAVVPLVKNERLADASYQAALIVRDDSLIDSLDALLGTRVAWVDRHSAAGYVIPRATLDARKYESSTLFREERFYGSHDAVVNAVLSGSAHVGATYARIGVNGEVLRGGWSDVKGADGVIRVLMTFGSIPGDLICARQGVRKESRAAVTRALVEASTDERIRSNVRAIFGVDAFREGPLDNYDLVRAALV